MRTCTKFLRLKAPTKFLRNATTVVEHPTKRQIEPKPTSSIPPLPVPELHSTLSRYLRSVRPFLTPEEYIQSEKVINQFGSPAGEGERLQYLLLDKAKDCDNWLKEWWLQSAYLEFRSPVVVFSSPGEVFPKQTFNSDEDILKCATNIISAALEFKQMIDDDVIPQEKIMGKPIDMSQYKKIFGTTRVPKFSSDCLSFHPNSEHIIVMYDNHIYKVNVKNCGKWISSGIIFEQLRSITSVCGCPGVPIGLLTSDHRDNWSKAYKDLSKKDTNMAALKSIEEALFVVCLDTICPQFCFNDMTTAGLQLIHGGGPSSNAGNRWYDKTLQFVIGKAGHIGITYEHSPAEGAPIAVLTDHVVEKLPSAVDTTPITLDESLKPCKLFFDLTDEAKGNISTARSNLNNLVNDLEVRCFSFDEFGKEQIKAFKLSPDSFIQMAIQYAFYRIHNVPGAQYESASTRMFIDGRTETIRSCSEESIRFARAMMDSCVPVQSKVNALKVAINSHKEYTVAALHARGVDRHLLGLKLIAQENNIPMPNFFCDTAFKRSSNMRLSTSQVSSTSDSFMVYGPLVKDGYGCCYNPRKENINFGTSAFVSCEETKLGQFKEYLEASLSEMKDILVKSPQAKL